MFFLFARAAFSIRSVSHEKHQFGSYEQTCCNGSNHMVSMWKTCELRIMGNGIALLLCKWEKWGTHTMKKNMENCTKKWWRNCVFSKIFDIHWVWYFGLGFVTDAEFYSDQNASELRRIWEERIRLIHLIALFLLNFSSMWNQKHNLEFVWCHTKYLLICSPEELYEKKMII